ncbi:MAG TPA: peptidylprolyl isomerase [Chthonomonadaceae bacterium]|nr:peptidylprolyl isomerase [Chthonomonadaceae bacterium]
MLQRALPALLTAALWASILPAAMAATKADKKAAPKGGAAAAPVSAVESEVVGSVNGKPVSTFGQLVTKFQKTSPPIFAEAVGVAIGQDATAQFFGSTPKSQITVTREAVLKGLRANAQRPFGNGQRQLSLASMLQQDLTQEAIRQAGVQRHATATDADVNAMVLYLVHQKRASMGAQVPASMTDDQFLNKVQPGLSLAKIKADPEIRVNATMFNLARLDIEKKLKHPIGDADFADVRHILVKADPLPPSPTPEQKKADADALAKATQIYNDLKAGKIKFEDAVKQYTDDPGSKETGGSYGTIMPSDAYVPEFLNAAFTTKSGEISKPFRTQFGYHILEVTKTGKDLKPEEKRNLLMSKEYAQSQITFQTIASEAKIVNKLQPEPTIPIPGGVRPGG